AQGIDTTPFPYVGSDDPRYAYREVLGVFSVPTTIQRAVRVHGFGWPYWMKAGLVARGGKGIVGVSVPRAWRNRVAITWGNGDATGVGVVPSLRGAPCDK